MSNEEMTAEIEQAIEEMAAEETVVEETTDNESKDDTIQDTDGLQEAAKGAVEEDSGGEDSRGDRSGEGANESGVSGQEAENEGDTIPEPVVISDGLLERAVKAGIPLGDAQNAYSEESLERIVGAMERNVKQSDIDKEKEDDLLADFPTLDPEVHGKDTVKAFNRLADIAREQQERLQALQNQQEEFTSAAYETASREVEQWFDKQVSKLGEDFTETLGAGSYSELSRGSPQFAKREAIANQMAVLHSGYQASGQQPPSREELFDTATKLVLQDEFQKLYEKKLAGELDSRASQHIQRAGSQRVASTSSPDEETAAILDEKYF